VGITLAMAEGPAGVGSAGGADKATVAASKALGPRAYGEGGGGACAGSMHHCESTSGRLLSRKGCGLARAPTGKGGGTCQGMEVMRPVEGYSPLGATEEGICRGRGKERPCGGHR